MKENTCQATAPSDLEQQIMNPSVAKNEREWWAAREIEKLRHRVMSAEAACCWWATKCGELAVKVDHLTAKVQRLRADG